VRLLTLLLIPFASFVFFYFLYQKTGNPYIYFETEKAGWGAAFSNPISTLLTYFGLKFDPYYGNLKLIYTTVGIFIVSEILLLIYAYKKIDHMYFIYWLVFFLIPLSSGIWVALSMPRHSLLFFPQYLVLANLAETKTLDFCISAFLITIQIFFMALWVNGIAII
jgi:hypothetical protein